MKFPLCQISDQPITEEAVLFDPFIFNPNEQYFLQTFKHQIYCDSNGWLFKIIDRKFPPQKWRYWFKWLPNTYRIELLFQPINDHISLIYLKQQLIQRIEISYHPSKYKEAWIQGIKNESTIEGIISMELDPN